jgi:hypothetical protein
MPDLAPCCTDPRTGLPVHDRLDLKQQTLEYTSPECGSPRRDTGKPDYCCFHCPTLKVLLTGTDK